MTIGIKRNSWKYFLDFKRRSLEKIFKNIPDKFFEKCLIIGAGNCMQADMLEKYCKKIICTEIDPRINEKVSTDTITYMQVDGENLLETFKDEHFDLIFTSSVFEHIPDIDKTLADIKTLLTEDGISINYMPNVLWKILHIGLHFIDKLVCILDRRILFKPKEIKQLFITNGNYNNVKSDYKYEFHLKNIFIPIAPHGCGKNHIEEFYNFSGFAWHKKFDKAGFKLLNSQGTTFSSGYLFGYGVLQNILELLGIYTESVYIICKKELNQYPKGYTYIKKTNKKVYELKENLKNIFSIENEYINNKKHKVINLCGFKIKFKINNIDNFINNSSEEEEYKLLVNLYGKEFIDIYNEVKNYTMITIDAAFENYKIINYLENNNIQGDIIECGVWKGGSCMLMAKTLQKRNNTSRHIWLFDTFDGMSEPTEKDVGVRDNQSAKKMLDNMKETSNYISGDTGWCEAQLEEVEHNLYSTKYPQENLHFIKGFVEETIPKYADQIQQIGFLRVDTDWYDSTKVELEFLYPKIVNKGVFVSDDYYTWRGAQIAVDEYYSKLNIAPLMVKVSDSIVVVKTEQ